MERFAAKVLRWLLCIEIVVLCSTGRAQTPSAERVVVFGVSHVKDEGALLEPVLDQVRAQLERDGRHEVWVRHWSWDAPEQVLAQAKALGREAFNQLATRAPEDVLRNYGKQITNGLRVVSGVPDVEGRSVLWNLCVLRVHLFLLTSTSPDEPEVRDAVQECMRRFPDRPQLGKVWSPEVEQAFARYTADVRKVPLSVKTAPGGCELRLFGSAVGVTPMVVDVLPGTQEIQIVCAGHTSAVHQIEAQEARDLVISLETDAAFVERRNAGWVLYKSETDAARTEDHASVLAAEAQADSFVLVKASGPDVAIDWVRLPASKVASGAVPLQGAEEQRAASIAHIFRGPSEAQQADAPSSRKHGRKRAWLDYAVGGGLLGIGAGLSVYPLFAIARDGQCVDTSCDSIYKGKGAAGIAMLTTAAALAVAGVTVLWVAPFGKRASVTVGNGIALKGNF